MSISGWVYGHKLAIGWCANVFSFAAGMGMQLFLSRSEKRERRQNAETRSIGQIVLIKQATLREYAGRSNQFSEEEMRTWLKPEEGLRLHASLYMLKTDGHARPIEGHAAHWMFL